ncbi:hypothetical protein AB3N59_06845 [Leptospira sp. WS92.C1]
MTVLIFKIVLGFFPEDNYLFRDDGIITLSHAKNWIDFGFIGVNLSGEIVEGFSSPLQFLIYSFVYKIGGLHYSIFFTFQWWLTSFLFGFVLYLLFQEIFESSKLENLAFSAGAIALLSVSFTFLAWHASGMENSWMHVLYLTYIFVLFKILIGNPIHPVFASLFLFAGMLVRIESVFHLFFVSATFLYLSYKNRISWKQTIPIWVAGVLWSLFFLIRFLYFGRLFPNTSTAQELSLSENMINLFRLSPSLGKNWEIFRFGFKQNLVLLIPVSFLLLFFKKIGTKEGIFVILAVALSVSGFMHPFIFGNFRLDPARPMTWLAVIGVVLFLIRIVAITEKRKIWILPILLLAGFLSYKNYKFKSYNLCCSSQIFEQRRSEVLQIVKSEQIQNASLAIADLGVLSFYKEFNILDLGYLGNQYLAKNKKNADKVFSYIRLNRPDVLEIHFPWSCEYSKLLNHPDFVKNYKLIFTTSEKAVLSSCLDGSKIVTGTFLYQGMAKDSPSIDRKIYSAFLKDPSLHALTSQIDLCNADQRNCFPLFRNLYRFVNRFKKNITDSEFVAASNSFTKPEFKVYAATIWDRKSPSDDLVQSIVKHSIEE